MPECIECVDDCSPLIADHPHFLEIDVERRQIFRDIADVLVLDAGFWSRCGRKELAADHQERSCDNLFGTGRDGGWALITYRLASALFSVRFKTHQRRGPGQPRKHAGGMVEKKERCPSQGAGAVGFC